MGKQSKNKPNTNLLKRNNELEKRNNELETCIKELEKQTQLPASPSTKASIRQIFKRNVSATFFFIAPFLVGWGVDGMNTGNILSPLLLAVSVLLIILAVFTNNDVWAYVTSKFHKRVTQILFVIIICMVFTLPTFSISQTITNNKQEQLAKTPIFLGELLPGKEPNPYNSYIENPFNIPNKTPIPVEAIRIMLGDDSGIYVSPSDNYTFALRGIPFLNVKFGDEGRILVTTQIIDNQNNKVIRVEDNVFQANPAYAFNPQQPNKYTIIVKDWDGNEVLHIKYLNQKTLWISGRFYSPEQQDTITIHSSGLIDGFKGMALRSIYLIESNPTGGIINIGG